MTIPSQQYANLADHTYGRDLDRTPVNLKQLVDKEVVIEGVTFKVVAHADKPSGYQGTIYQRVDTGELVVSHRGTEPDRELWKDGVLADGGMVVGRVNSQAQDAKALTREALAYAQEDPGKWGKVPEVTVTGHSLGGTLAQITAHHYGLKGEAFNPYGVASLNYRIPEGPQTPPFVNHVMAADVVSAAAPHYGEIRMYAERGEVHQLRAAGYNNISVIGGLQPNTVIGASLSGSHLMHNFTNRNGDGRHDASILSQPDARTLAQDNQLMISRYRGDVETLRNTATVGGQVVDVLRGGPLFAPARALDKIRNSMQPDLPPGEPARQEEQRRKTSQLDDMRDPAHPANGRYQQAYAGVCDVDRSLGRTPDAHSERAAAALAASCAHLRSLDQVLLSDDGSRIFGREAGRGNGLQQMGYVDTALAVQQPVEASTRQWAENSQQVQAHQTLVAQQQQAQREQTVQQEAMARA